MANPTNGSWQQTIADLLELIDGNTSGAVGGGSGSEASTVNATTTPLAAGASFTGTAELNDYNDVMVQVKTDQNGTYYMQFSPDGTNWDTSLSFEYDTSKINPPHILVKANRYFRIIFTNTSASAQTYLRLNTYYGSFQKLTAPTNGTVAPNYDALIVRPTDFSIEVADGKRQGVASNTKFGGNFAVQASNEEDFWNGQDRYTGHDPVAQETLTVVSADVDDTGVLIYTGSVTGTGEGTLTDSAATFVTDGVLVRDIIINDTTGTHAFVKSIDSETQLTIWNNHLFDYSVGDTIRIASYFSTGASVVKITNGLDADFEKITPEYVILNGTTPVTTTNSYLRMSSAQVVHAGSSGLNEGEITFAQSTTTANVMAVMPTDGRTKICANTVPDHKAHIIKRINVQLARDGAQAASADVYLYAREFGGAWNAVRRWTITTASPISINQEVGLAFPEYTDYKLTVSNASAAVKVTGELEYFELDE